MHLGGWLSDNKEDTQTTKEILHVMFYVLSFSFKHVGLLCNVMLMLVHQVHYGELFS
uniref:Uncharacterized protein n=1 Tax=Nelumbo nucifera TaxID=4432 RepID=A0A822YZK0_NELNU|nr:TPA_asm: hypothetical protein HUJ06_006816 [Nelumbo nucifera]